MQFARGDHYTLGGTSAGKALHLSSLGRSTRLYTAVGTDGAAALIIDSLSLDPPTAGGNGSRFTE
jgi:acarbose 7IV-phosphotransferase